MGVLTSPDSENMQTKTIPMFWYAVYVRSRHEFKVRDLMEKTRLEVFLPTIDLLRRWKDRKKIITFPLFPGYVFVNITERKEDMLEVLRTHGVVRFISINPGRPSPVPDTQIKSLKQIVENKIPIEPYPYLKQGQRVRITNGSLAGVEGVLKQRKGQQILILSVDILQQGASVKIDAVDVEPV